MNSYYVYILECSDRTYYTGVTNNLNRRLAEHKSGAEPGSYTYIRRPIELVYYEEFNDINNAILLEKRIKGWSRKKKEALINDNFEELVRLSNLKNKSKSIM
jgi:putative endonuclease